MEVEKPMAAAEVVEEEEEEEEEDVSELQEALEEAQAVKQGHLKIPLLLKIIQNTEKLSPAAISIKERAVYDLTRAYCESSDFESVVEFLTGDTGASFLHSITKAKTAKLVRQILDIVCSHAILEMQESVARSILDWTEKRKRSFLRQRVEAKLAGILFQRSKYAEALSITDRLLMELKKLDDKQLLVETHLLESKLHFALRNVAKAKAALTACRTAANSIYVSPTQQAEIDSMSGTIHTEEGDYNTAHSYFLEAFEQLDQMNENAQAVLALKYMMLCKILDSLRIALKLSSAGNVGISASPSASATATESGMLTGKQAVKYAGKEIEAMQKIATAAQNRNLKEFEAVLLAYPQQLQEDLLIKHHLHVLKEQLLESNLIRIIEPYSCVELEFIAAKIELPVSVTERKLSQMILDGKFQGILDQGKGQLVVYEENETDSTMEKGLQVIANMDKVVTSLFERSKALRTMMT
jgi:26S proteasome regulatory subunit N6